MLRYFQNIIWLDRLGIIIAVGVALFSQNVVAYESMRILPGARASSMAGIFTAQADDSSAIWYNPAGLAHQKTISNDVTVDFGNSIEPKEGTADNAELASSNNTINYVAAYASDIKWLQAYIGTSGVGISYYRPYTLRTTVEEPRGLIDTRPYGDVDLRYHQISYLISTLLPNSISFGVTVDQFWSTVRCVSDVNCSSGTASGLGASAGLLMDLYQVRQTKLKLGIVWKSRISLNYFADNDAGIGAFIGRYIPGRPASRSFALAVQIPTEKVLINANMLFKNVYWSKATHTSSQISDYLIYGLGAEFVFPIRKTQSWSYRFGIKHASPNIGLSPTIDTLAMGVGASFFGDHFIDLSVEKRTIRSLENSLDTLISVAYSYQK